MSAPSHDNAGAMDRYEAGQMRRRDERFVRAGWKEYAGRYGTRALMTTEAQQRMEVGGDD